MPDATTSSASGELSALRRFAGPPREFWPRFAAALADLCDADRCLLAAKQGAENATWKKLHDWAHNEIPVPANTAFTAQLIQLADRATADSPLLAPLPRAGSVAIGVRLPLPDAADVAVALLLLTDTTEAAAREMLARLSLAADTPLLYQESQRVSQSRAETEKFAGTLDVLAQFNEHTRFFPAGLALCNALATRFGCDRVSLGCLAGPTVKLRVLSRTEKFNRQMAAAQALEVAMEEAIDQDADLVFPAPPEAVHITRDHEKYSRGQNVAHLASFPLRTGSKLVGCVTCERAEPAFRELELQQLRLTIDLATRRLADLQQHDRWFGARWAAWWREQLGLLVGRQHTWAKILSLLILAGLLLLVFLKLPYRIEAAFQLRTDDQAFLSAPFDGYLSEVLVRAGDTVTNGQPILRFDTKDLLLQESAALADLQRYQRETEKARAARQLADMRIAEALALQTQAQLDLLHHRLEQATLRSPFDGVIVEGDLRDRLGAPAKQGDALFRIAKLQGLYVQADVPERDIHELKGSETGEIAFYSQPRLKFPIRGLNLEPAATAKEGGNVFQMRCALVNAPAPWFRPGMSGLAKVNVGPRRLIWILTHRTVDFLRMFFWW